MCGAGSLSEGREWWLDVGIIEDFYGRVYYCSICFGQMATEAGFLTPAKRQELEQKVRDAHARIEEAESAMGNLATLGIDVSTIHRYVEDHHVSLEGTERNLDALIERTNPVDEQTDEQGSDDVSDSQPGTQPKLSLT